MRRARRLVGIGLLACWWGHATRVEAAAILGERQEVFLDSRGGLPGTWVSCAERCAGGGGPRMTMLGAGGGDSRLRWEIPGDAAATATLEGLEYVVQANEEGGDAVVTLGARDAFRGVRLVQRYAVSMAGYTLSASLQVPRGARLVLESGAAFVPEPLPGFASIYDSVKAVQVTAAGQQALADGVALAGSEWVGIRNRFWTLLLRPAVALTAGVRTTTPNRPRVDLEPGPDAATLNVVLYAGPVERGRVVAVDPVLGGLLFAALWNWLRAISFGLLDVVEGWHALVGGYGAAIVLLSLSVKVAMWPLTFVAERWQREVNRIQSLLEPELARVRRDFRGEEAHRRTLAVYRQHGVSPFFPARSALGVLIQIPIFIAAFDMLGENFGLNGASFLWIDDLALPDRLGALPFTVPFLGAHLNLLPFVMTALTVLAARSQEAPSLSAALRARERRRLYGMALAFFVLLYAFPAGMVLYWTSNNLWHLLKVLAVRAAAVRR